MKYLLSCILFLSFENAFCQSDSIPLKMAQYAFYKNTGLLFVHTDKHIYTNNELIWFSAWLMRCGIDSLPFHRLVSLALVPADTHLPALQQKFLMTNGYSYGSMLLPDPISPGEYKLVAYTNIIGADSVPLAAFTQEISIRSVHQCEFMAAATLLEDTTGRKDLLITVRNKITGKPVRNAELSLWCGNSKVINAITNKDGIYRQSLAALKPVTTNAAIVITKVKYNKEVDYLQHTWPWEITERKLEMNCYPEGGYLVSNVPCNIGWESKTNQGEPVAIRAVLFEDQHAVDTIRTNEQGLGKFMLVPHADATYTIRPITWPAGMSLQKDGYLLPVVLTNGITLTIPKAITGDSLRFNLFGAGVSKAQLVVHNFQEVFQQQDITLKPGGVSILLLLENVPKGVTAITLLDSNARPLAERLFFAHYHDMTVCTITPDKRVYEKRQPVTVSFQLNSNPPAGAFASVACAQANRFENSKQQDIESFFYLHSALQDAPFCHNGQGYRDTGFLENVLLVRGWRRYTWQEFMAGNYAMPAFYSPTIGGKVIPGFGRIKKPVLVAMLNGNAHIPYVTTDNSGSFLFDYEQLLVDQEKKLWISSGDKALQNKVSINDPFVAINKRLASHMQFNPVDADKYLQHAMELALNDVNKVKQLAVVTVTAKGTDKTLFGSPVNACGDYVCQYGILNCNNHGFQLGNHSPVKGQVYRINGGGQTVYQGCMLEDTTTMRMLQYDGIKIGKEYYKVDLNEVITGNPLYNSTLFWSPTLIFDKDGKAEATFNTSDITGKFRIVVNGMAGDNMFYATGIIEVK